MNDAMADPECIKTYVNVPADHIPLMDGYEMEKEQDNDDGTARWEYEGDAYSVMSAVNKVVDIDYDKFYGCIDKVFGEPAKIESYVKLSFKFDDKFFDKNILVE